MNALKLYDTLFNSISHEFRTPIATILGSTDNLLTLNAKFSEKDKNNLYQEINTAADRLNRLVGNLLNVSRLESGSIRPKLDWNDLSELIHTAINQLETELKSHEIKVTMPPNLPFLKLDFGLLEQAIYNILYNCSIYTPEKTLIHVSADYLDEKCVIQIQDSGKGFPKGDLSQVFSKFYRSKNTQTGGLGLGLSITKGFIEAHNGSIKVENTAGSGALFTIEIPTKANWGDDFSGGFLQ